MLLFNCLTVNNAVRQMGHTQGSKQHASLRCGDKCTVYTLKPSGIQHTPDIAYE